ncbi:N-formylglutamate amidohydrolase [Rhodococcus aetherivorans]|uniref:N-formylglutamate amidohydrolase n=1 Tax=Rhodococcus aetherivorans TaxID=191292 RepID=UPI0021A272AB|nr:N-formylglutamate amidohydrolase [Rhodococcus aetherivorans]
MAAELDEATDTGTADIDAAAAERARRRPAVAVNRLSRLVVDPERLPDEQEPAAAYGRGAVYTRTCTGTPLRLEPYPRAAELLDTYFCPYADTVTAVVDDRLRVCGRAVIVDLHSYPLAPSGFEEPTAVRPALCLGTDPVHTPAWLVDAARGAFASLPGIDHIAENTPYSGSYVPLRHYGRTSVRAARSRR